MHVGTCSCGDDLDSVITDSGKELVTCWGCGKTFNFDDTKKVE